MGGIRPIGKVPDLPESRKAPSRERDRTEQAAGRDEVEISPEARRANEVERLVEAARDLPEVRSEQVEEAREELQTEQHRDPDALRETARRLLGG